MTVAELVARFPEIPRDLHGEPTLARFAETFGSLLRVARPPSPCSSRHDAANHYYLKLVGPFSIYGYGLSTRERVLADMLELLDEHDADPAGFAAGLLPAGAAESEVRGPGCSGAP
jgi:hypothetical protein